MIEADTPIALSLAAQALHEPTLAVEALLLSVAGIYVETACAADYDALRGKENA